MQLGRKLAEGYAVDATEIGEEPQVPQDAPEVVTAESPAETVAVAAPAQA